MSWAKNLQLRPHLARIVAISALVAAFLMLAFGRSAGRYDAQLGEIVNYWQLVTNYSEFAYSSIFTVMLLLAFLFVPALIVAPHGKGLPAIGVMLIANMIACFVCTMNTFGNRTILAHQQTIEFRHQIYHLALETDYEDDFTVPNLLLFECTDAGATCAPIYFQYWYPERMKASFLVDEVNNALHLQLDGETVYTIH